MPRSASLRLAVAAALTATSAAAAQAQTRTWDFGDTSAPGSCGQVSAGGANGVGNMWGCSAQPTSTAISLYVSAHSTSTLNAAGTLSKAAITPQGTSGIGVGSAAEGGRFASGTAGAHAMDNNPASGTSTAQGGADLLMLSFVGGPYVLNQVQFGWTDSDADFQVLRWAGAGLPGDATTVGSALTNGWQLVSTVAGAGATAYNVNAAGLASSYWALSAYNPGWGTSAGYTADGTPDRFKVRSVTASVVPEPSTYALMGTGLAGLLAAARRRRSA